MILYAYIALLFGFFYLAICKEIEKQKIQTKNEILELSVSLEILEKKLFRMSGNHDYYMILFRFELENLNKQLIKNQERGF